jgi:hypothetical protein
MLAFTDAAEDDRHVLLVPEDPVDEEVTAGVAGADALAGSRHGRRPILAPRRRALAPSAAMSSSFAGASYPLIPSVRSGPPR